VLLSDGRLGGWSWVGGFADASSPVPVASVALGGAGGKHGSVDVKSNHGAGVGVMVPEGGGKEGGAGGFGVRGDGCNPLRALCAWWGAGVSPASMLSGMPG